MSTYGKFQGEPRYVEYFWKRSLDGTSEYRGDWNRVDITERERRRFPGLGRAKYIELHESDQGFVYHRLVGKIGKLPGGAGKELHAMVAERARRAGGEAGGLMKTSVGFKIPFSYKGVVVGYVALSGKGEHARTVGNFYDPGRPGSPVTYHGILPESVINAYQHARGEIGVEAYRERMFAAAQEPGRPTGAQLGRRKRASGPSAAKHESGGNPHFYVVHQGKIGRVVESRRDAEDIARSDYEGVTRVVGEDGLRVLGLDPNRQSDWTSARSLASAARHERGGNPRVSLPPLIDGARHGYQIRQHKSGVYQIYRGRPALSSTPLYTSHDLERSRAWIASRVGSEKTQSGGNPHVSQGLKTRIEKLVGRSGKK
jgi:hypothetical protein